MTTSIQTYDIFDNDFKKIGTIKADSAEGALTAAKKRFPLVPAPMVQPTPVTPRAQRSIAPRGN